MEAPDLLEIGDTPQQKKLSCCQVAFYTSIFVFIMISALFSVVCFLHHKQLISFPSIPWAPGTCWAHGFLRETSIQQNERAISWKWNTEHCDGLVEDNDQYLEIEQSGNYFIYAQVNRKTNTTKAFTFALFKEPSITLNKVGGSEKSAGVGTINFGRPFYLQKGDRLYCQVNFDVKFILEGNQSYWGLYKM